MCNSVAAAVIMKESSKEVEMESKRNMTFLIKGHKNAFPNPNFNIPMLKIKEQCQAFIAEIRTVFYSIYYLALRRMEKLGLE